MRPAGQLLAALAEPLQPARTPFYLRSDTRHPDGWYWQPEQAGRTEYLGRNVIWAERKLIELLDRRVPA